MHCQQGAFSTVCQRMDQWRSRRVETVLQCVSACTDRLCAQNKVVTQGITAPLEVFHTGAAQAAPVS